MSARGMTMMMTLDRVKRCQKCCEIMDVSAFSADRTRGDGLQPKCKGCHAAYRSANRDHILSKKKEHSARYRPVYYAANAEALRAKSRAFNIANPAITAAARRKWIAANPERKRELTRKWVSENRAKVTAIRAFRYARKISATPSWADRDAIQRVYDLAAQLTIETGIMHHVDHIIPLISKFVCGLHVENNLRAIPALENAKKSNKILVELL